MPEQSLTKFIASRAVPGRIDYIVVQSSSWAYCRQYYGVVFRVVPGIVYKTARVVPGMKCQYLSNKDRDWGWVLGIWTSLVFGIGIGKLGNRIWIKGWGLVLRIRIGDCH